MGPTNPHYHEKPAYIFNHDVQLGEGIQQALWLTKSQLMGDGQVNILHYLFVRMIKAS